MQYLIIGCGAAAVGAGKAIREHDPDSNLTFVTYESTPFYLRPLLSDFVSGDIDSDELALKEKFTSSDKIRILTGKRACKLEENKVVFTDGEFLAFNFLLIATGARPILDGVYLKNRDKIFTLRSLNDAVRIKNANADSALVVGHGVCAYEAVRALYKLNIKVSFLKDRRNGTLDIPEIEEKIKKLGIPVISGAGVLDILDIDGKKYRVITSSGESIEAGLIVAAFGYIPDVEWVRASGINCGTGVLVNEELQTNVPNVYAAGDAAQVQLIGSDEHKVNFGWQSAYKQGEIAGQNMTGRDRIYITGQEPYFQGIYGKKFSERW